MKKRILKFLGGFLGSGIIMAIFLASNHFGLERAGRKIIPMETNDLFYILGSCVLMGIIFSLFTKNKREE
jgi:hypothetical protein